MITIGELRLDRQRQSRTRAALRLPGAALSEVSNTGVFLLDKEAGYIAPGSGITRLWGALPQPFDYWSHHSKSRALYGRGSANDLMHGGC